MNQDCKCPLSSDCNARRGYFDCAKKLLKLVEGQKPPTNSVMNAIAALTEQLGLPVKQRDWGVIFEVRNELRKQHP